MSRKGTCKNCGRENMTLPAYGLCGKCYGAAQKRDREFKEIEKKFIESRPLPAEAALPPSSGNGLFPPLTLTFEERDAALVDFIEEDATKHRRTPDQHILWILEQHYENLLHT